jgi:hypothetical protein
LTAKVWYGGRNRKSKARKPRAEAARPGPRPPVAAAATTTRRNASTTLVLETSSRKSSSNAVAALVPATATV